jgi:pyruvate dehydrogenase E1 component alpha subunit
LIDKEARAIVDKAVKDAQEGPEPPMEDFWTEIYVPGTEPKSLRGVDPEEVKFFH